MTANQSKRRIRFSHNRSDESEAGHTLLEVLHDAVIIIDSKYNILSANDVVAEKTRFGKNDILQHGLLEFLIPETKQSATNILGKLMKGTPVKTFELEMKTKGDKRLRMEVNATIAKYKHKPAAVLILRDVTERKQIERRLRESEEKYRTIVETSIQGIAIAQDGRVVLTNAALSNISGYTIEELLSLSPEQAMALIHSDDRVRIESVFQDRLAGKIVPATYELRMIRKDGTVRWLQVYSTLMKYNGRPAIQISCIDITNHKKAEEEIRTLARYPYENPNPILRVNKDGVILHANPASEVLLQNWGCEVGSPAPKFCQDAVIKAFRESISRSIETTVSDKVYLFYIKPIPEEGYANLYGRDITERKKIEEELEKHALHLGELVEDRALELKASEQRYRVLVDNISDAIFTIDLKGNYTFVNQSTEKMTKYSLARLLSMNMKELIAPEFYSQVLERLHFHTLGRTDLLPMEFEIVRADGKRILIEMRTSPLHDGEGTLIGVQGIARDITERKQIEKQLLESRRLAAIGEIASMVGHDLRNPLQVMVNRLFLAEKAAKDLSYPYSDVAKKLDLEDLFRDLEDQTQYMNKIVSDLQDYAKPLVPEMMETNLRKLVEATFSTIDVPKNITVSTELLKDARLTVDPALIRRIFTNIIMNALQAMPDGGKLTIRTLNSAENVSLDFQDTGVGIPKENMDKIFNPLFTTKAKGTGLGLPVCKRLVEAHSGRIAVESNVGEGTRVKVVLPIKPKYA